MKKVFLALLLTTILFTGCLKAPENQLPLSPESVVQAFLKAASEGDVDTCLDLLAEDVVFRQEPSDTTVTGKTEIEAGLRQQVAWHQQCTIVGPVTTDGDKIKLTVRQTGDDCRLMGIEHITGDVEAQVSNGKIKSWTVTMSQEDLKKISELTAGGIGIKMEVTAQGIKVTGLAKSSPAIEAGLRTGDLIIAVDGVAYSQMREGEIQLRIKGRVGSKVKLTVTNEGASAPREIEVTRVSLEALQY